MLIINYKNIKVVSSLINTFIILHLFDVDKDPIREKKRYAKVVDLIRKQLLLIKSFPWSENYVH